MASTRAPATAAPGGGLLRILGTAFGLAIAIGATIGGGIVRTPGEVAAHLPSAGLYMGVWALGGVGALFGATMFAELGAAVPRSGGVYVFAHRALGDGVGFFVGWLDWFNWMLGWAGLTLIVGEYTTELLPALAGHATAVSLAVLTALVIAGWRGTRTAGGIQEATSLLKTLALLALVAAAFVLPHAAVGVATGGAARGGAGASGGGGAAAAAGAAPALPHGWGLLVAMALAMQGVVFTYDSYYAVVYCGEEMRDPGREVPRSVFRGLWLIIGIYLLVNAAYLAVVPIGRMAGDNFVGGTMTRAIFGARGDAAIRLLMIVSVLGTVNAHVITVPRIMLAMSRDGLFPRFARRINAGGTPSAALGVSYAVTALFVLSGSFATILGIEGIVIVTMYVVTFVSFFVLRRREPALERPYRAWGYPWVQGVMLLFTVALLAAMVVGDVIHALVVLVLLLASGPAARLARRWIGSDPLRE